MYKIAQTEGFDPRVNLINEERNVSTVEQPSGEIGSYTTEISSRLRPFGGRYLPYVATRPTIEF